MPRSLLLPILPIASALLVLCACARPGSAEDTPTVDDNTRAKASSSGCLATGDSTSGPLAVRNGAYRVELVDEVPIPERPFPAVHYVFRIARETTAEPTSLFLGTAYGDPPVADAEINLRLLRNDRLVVHATRKEGSNPADHISVVDLRSNKLIDEFFCREVEPSPSGRYWVYEKLTPIRFAPPAAMTTVVLLYDMEKTPLENRLFANRGLDPEEVGKPIYPERYVEAQAYEVPEQWEHNRIEYLLQSSFLWDQDESRIVFLCARWAQPTDLVCVSFEKGVEHPVITKAQIPAADYAKPGAIDTVKHPENANGWPYLVSAKEFAWVDGEHVFIRNPYLPELQDEIVLAVPKSQPCQEPEADVK